MATPDRVLVTPDAAQVLREVADEHGPLMFHQSGGCCDGSSPMCYTRGEFLIGDRDVLLGVLLPKAMGDDDPGTPVWISGSQYAAWKHTQLVLDVVPGRGGGFSLEAPRGVRFLTRGRVYTAEEQEQLDADPPLRGADIEAGAAWPVPDSDTIVDEATLVDICSITPTAPV